MIYNMMVTEYLRKTVRVEAEDIFEAKDKVLDLISSEELVLSADDFCDRDIETMDEYEHNCGSYGTCLTNDRDFSVDLDFSNN
jgi:hypothetical protein